MLSFATVAESRPDNWTLETVADGAGSLRASKKLKIPCGLPKAVTAMGWIWYLMPSISFGEGSDTVIDANPTPADEAVADNMDIMPSMDA